MRRFVLAISLAVLAVVGVMIPASASAAEESVSVQSSAVTVAAADELDFAVAGSPPPFSQMKCFSSANVAVCYQKSGDKWWVQDLDADGASSGVMWENYRDGILYRVGFCFSSLGKGKWGYCNKNYYEDSALYGGSCVWNRSATGTAYCGPRDSKFQ